MEFLSEYHLAGLFIGICTFLIIGLFHPVVVKAEYYWGTKCWWIFLILGIAGVVASLSIENVIIASLLGVFAFSSFWTIKEVFEQEESVQRLIDLGVIVGSGYHVNPKSLGYRTCTYVGIKLEKGSMYKSVVAELQKIPEIVECHFTTGPYTMLTKLYACDNEHLMDLLNNKMQEIPGVVATETLISLEQSIKKEIPIRVEK